MKLAKKIFSVFLSGLFLLSFTGISLMLHHCMPCEATEYYLAAYSGHIDHQHDDHLCCDDKEKYNFHKNNSSDSYHSCGIFGNNSNCCKTEVKYLKNDYEINHINITYKLIQPVCLSDKSFINDKLYTQIFDGQILKDYKDPPIKIVAKAFIIFTNRLKYC